MMHWPSLIQLGTITLLVPVALVIALALSVGGAWRSALRWLVSFSLGAALVGAAKFAFDYGGWYLPQLGLYSVSGHAMLTAATYPVLLMLLGSALSPRVARIGWFAGLALGLAMAVKLVSGNYHTLSETLLGGAVGLAVAWLNAGIRIRGPAPQIVLVAALGIGAFVFVNVRGLLYPVKAAMWEHAAPWQDGTVRHYRQIDADPVTGETRITVRKRSCLSKRGRQAPRLLTPSKTGTSTRTPSLLSTQTT
ncbi:Membrane-associated phosphatase [Cupriavidus necator]|uniref:Membrane-associated phosphatase n=1 Tax=Cupriavidus necator (strain ATCC 17699 / DSM 428 / KCTC 22496 / NCIMB 10442 / H16 / Stanier 337) TaxID=381666 RepID=Q0K578_CUPNH|nr:phosphatase PAP2 family protein [Cupriavidus necator]QCC02793.1 phosphatase PAP2 family protein [Cupriavidus necator H16]QQB79845.1 phosphatase PAP2 family protein [Cupriavidus necator]WKA44093.1 phosphatase PAP2 family protein [Cupriavidus necator]CAJ94846.1 Membrane-associated phosphatase [Cupriavidus necator H16]